MVELIVSCLNGVSMHVRFKANTEYMENESLDTLVKGRRQEV